ncbi:MAG: bifunctional [glutamate--ammonia ligase]-adenylyl-L-tyrosine phosphorylase/[glutamate--ammonia-ligase] adenylyltransferase, partial [Nitrospinaceae bacterium]|nr:bifunctional [glutamate--ammonia ligase]-adenylyl-L-tyrosine phosphorylase/[glutamate--ammonia-ligase] adenylyltransferase [Nitrospinaceae bacterium]
MTTLSAQIEDFLHQHPEATPIKSALRYSLFARRLLSRDPDQWEFLVAHYNKPWDETQMLDILSRHGINDVNALKRVLRRLRNQVMLRLIVRDIGGLADLYEVMNTTTCLTEVAIPFALKHLNTWQQSIYGIPCAGKDEKPQDLIVIGMGKLGGRELNVSSDIDLIFAYPEEGETRGPKKVDNHTYFTDLAQLLIKVLNDVTEDGFVFRVDMRLRPFGSSGPLVCCFEMLEQYYQIQGREWERYAWIKGRAICGTKGEELANMMRPFLYRKYLDFGSIQALRELKDQILKEVRGSKLDLNIKLGRGGIRDIEFTAQVFQLIYGGRNKSLQVRPTMEALVQLRNNSILTEKAVDELRAAYIFLRNVEHRLQYHQDQQTHTLPADTDIRKSLADTMKYSSWEKFHASLVKHRANVTDHFERILTVPPAADQHHPLRPLWIDELEDSDAIQRLEELGYKDTANTWKHLTQNKQSDRYQRLPEISKERFDKILPSVIEASASFNNPDTTLKRVLRLLENVCRRASYLALLAESPHVLYRVVKLVSSSRWLADYLTRHPLLLNKLLDERDADPFIRKEVLERSLVNELATYDNDNIEDQMNCLRHFKHARIFDLAIHGISSPRSFESSCGEITKLTEVLLQYILKAVWRQMNKEGEPKFSIIAYGKLGSREMTYNSDVDIVFLYDDSGPEALDTYIRLSQRINLWLTTHTSEGILYKTDFRLRPDGAQGLLAVPIKSFADYLQKRAWIWEHQALTRGRWVAGDESVGLEFNDIREEVLRQRRDISGLGREIVKMRDKMRKEEKKIAGSFDLKHHRGG